MPTTASILRAVRQIHLYLGVFIAPALLFFALTGALQTFNLHEATPGSTYKPAHWIIVLAQIHKKQTDVVPVRKKAPAAAEDKRDNAAAGTADNGERRHKAAPDAGAPAAPAPQPAPPPPPQKSHLPLKIFFLIVTVSLFTSTLTGLYMAYKYRNNKTLVTALLILGIVIPLALLPF